MDRKVIASNSVPAAVGPYSQAVRTGNLLFTSGQIGIDPQLGKLVEGGVEAQARQVMKNLTSLLEAGGSDFSRAVKTVIFLADMGDFSKVNEIYRSFLDEKAGFPARSTVAVKDLPLGALVEIEVIAITAD